MWFVVDRGGTLCIACGGYKLIHINPHETGVNLQRCFVVLYIYIYIYTCLCVIMETMCPPGYYHNSFVATHALGHMMYVRRA